MSYAHRDAGRDAALLTTHLAYGPGRSQIRTAQVRTLAAFVAAHAADCA